ncbi:hypothetical protein [Paraburkholderia phenoliruptrix]|uniref:hypothetical protein n=1 Tax=Paraburkholderia phenoliruptrix TaxID=252970 RepID=UPI0011D2B0BB|nr:hypothetical protein [Paraburkholderia phenoliruptrix]MDR6423448.1 hypothetical protein [Paraburkholderia phenoliruptrix]
MAKPLFLYDKPEKMACTLPALAINYWQLFNKQSCADATGCNTHEVISEVKVPLKTASAAYALSNWNARKGPIIFILKVWELSSIDIVRLSTAYSYLRLMPPSSRQMKSRL